MTRLCWSSVIAGVLLLLVVKYVVFGLDNWDAAFHPGRTEPADSPWRKPLLGILSA